MSRRASLPMYAVPDEALALFWQALRGHLVAAGLEDVPATLDAPDDLEAYWLAPDLLLSQTCGFPLVTGLAGRVQYVGTPHYRAEGCEGATYRSAVVVRADEPGSRLTDLRGRRVAFNSMDSQSGYNSLRALVAPLAGGGPFFAGRVETGSHRASVAAVRDGTADLAAVDVVTLALLRRDRPAEWTGLRVLAVTPPTPGLPFITAASTSPVDVARLRTGLRAAFADTALAAVRADLLLDGFSVLPGSAYDAIATLHATAVALGYPHLA